MVTILIAAIAAAFLVSAQNRGKHFVTEIVLLVFFGKMPAKHCLLFL